MLFRSHVLRAKETILEEYLYIITRTHQFRRIGEINMTGTAGQKRVPTVFIKNYEFLLPPLPEQKAIASLLSVWDEAIEKTERLIEVKEKIFHSSRKELITKTDESFCTYKLKEICKIVKGEQLNVTNMIKDGDYYVLNGGVFPSGFTNQWNTIANTISISEGGNSCGFVNYNKENFWADCHCYTLKELTKNVTTDFL